MSLSFVDELQTQVEMLENKILEAEAVGKDSGGDRIALSHLKALIEHFGISEEIRGERESAGGVVAGAAASSDKEGPSNRANQSRNEALIREACRLLPPHPLTDRYLSGCRGWLPVPAQEAL